MSQIHQKKNPSQLIAYCYNCKNYSIQQQQMNKEIPLGNKIIFQKMYKKERQRQKTRLQQIKLRPQSLHKDPAQFRLTTHMDQKNLEVQRNNIALFNRIANILREKPRIQLPKSRHYVQSLDQAQFKQEKKMEELRIKNNDLLKRINQQQPTIKNQIIMKDRAKQQGYLSFIGRYPFKPFRRTHTEYQISKDQRSEVFRQQSLDFDICIMHQPEADQYTFIVKDLVDPKQYRLTMQGIRFKEQLANCGLSYYQMVARLRMQKGGEMFYSDLPAAPSLSNRKER